MSLVNVVAMNVLDNPTSFTNPFQFEITFESLQDLKEDLEWKVVYVGNPEDDIGDQVLEEVMVGPVAVGIHRFVLQSNPPNPSLIRNEDLIGVTVVLVICSYMEKEFIRIGYYLRNEYSEPFEEDNYPNPVLIEKLFRNVLANEPRVTRIPINWDGDANQESNSYPGMQMGNNEDDKGIKDDDGEDDVNNVDMNEEDDDDDDDDDEGDEGEEGDVDEGEVDLEQEDDEDDDEDDEEEDDEEADGDDIVVDDDDDDDDDDGGVEETGVINA